VDSVNAVALNTCWFNGQSATPWSCGDGDGVVDGDLEVVVVVEVMFKGCPLR
jgi:hypothetical protein